LLLHIDGPNSIEAILDRLHGHERGKADDITWTAGLAMCPDEASSVDDLYRVADQRLYEAKGTSQGSKRNAESSSRS
jgi:GGDEF domain-containing protein